MCWSKSSKSKRPVQQQTKYVSNTWPSGSDHEEFQLLNVEDSSTRPIIADIRINGKLLTMEVDTGATVSIIPEKTLKQILPQAKLQPSHITLRTYTEERMKVRGELSDDVTYRQQHKQLTLIVVAGAGPS